MTHSSPEIERHPGPFSGPDADLARAIAMAVIPWYGNDDGPTHERIMKNGIWNDHIAVQAALAAIHHLRTPAQTPCTVHDTDINGHCQRCGETILRISKVTPPQAAPAAEECARIAEGHVGAGGASPNTDGAYSYDEACRDIAKAIRDAMGVKA